MSSFVTVSADGRVRREETWRRRRQGSSRPKQGREEDAAHSAPEAPTWSPQPSDSHPSPFQAPARGEKQCLPCLSQMFEKHINHFNKY